MTASTGNHALAFCHVLTKVNKKGIIFVTSTIPETKLNKLEKFDNIEVLFYVVHNFIFINSIVFEAFWLSIKTYIYKLGLIPFHQLESQIVSISVHYLSTNLSVESYWRRPTVRRNSSSGLCPREWTQIYLTLQWLRDHRGTGYLWARNFESMERRV